MNHGKLAQKVMLVPIGVCGTKMKSSNFNEYPCILRRKLYFNQ
jgi:hypothetical protein